MFRLYGGIERNGKWYNHAELEKLTGTTLAMLDLPDQTSVALLLNIIKNCLKKVFTASGEAFELRESDYLDIFFNDAWRICYELMKVVNHNEHTVIPEYFMCPRCSKMGDERYTKVEECWQDLIDKGLMDEHFFESFEQVRMPIKLAHGLEIPDIGNMKGGLFKEIVMTPRTIGEVLDVVHTPGCLENHARMVFAMWDIGIKEVKGLSMKELNILKRNLADSFTKKYITSNDDLDILNDAIPKFGIDASPRRVNCKVCGGQIGGFLDFTNFFDFLFSRKSNRKGLPIVGM
jgi:hypothetical protein